MLFRFSARGFTNEVRAFVLSSNCLTHYCVKAKLHDHGSFQTISSFLLFKKYIHLEILDAQTGFIDTMISSCSFPGVGILCIVEENDGYVNLKYIITNLNFFKVLIFCIVNSRFYLVLMKLKNKQSLGGDVILPKYPSNNADLFHHSLLQGFMGRIRKRMHNILWIPTLLVVKILAFFFKSRCLFSYRLIGLFIDEGEEIQSFYWDSLIEFQVRVNFFPCNNKR